MRYLKRISILTAFLLMFTLIHVTVAEDGIVLDVAERIEEALEIEMDEVNADGLEALDVPLFSLEAVNLELRDAEDTQLISESEEQAETQEKANDSDDFEIDEDGELTRYRGFAKNVVIPNGVKGIGDYAFSNATLVESVSIPYSITYIESSAFYNCTGLKSITIPDSVTEIGGCAFSDCESLANVQLSKNLTEISPSLFDGCISLEQIILPNGIRKIGDSAFSSCEKIKSIVLPDTVEVIDESAFRYCSNLESVTISASVSSIDRTAFEGCENVIIRGEEGSYAERFANGVGIPFNAPIVTIDEETQYIYDDATLILDGLILYINQSRAINVIQEPADLARTLVWSSSNTNVVAVDQSGNIKGISQGMSTVTVNTADGKGRAAQIGIFVPEPTDIDMNYWDNDREITLGETSTIRVERYIPYRYETDMEMPTTWSSSDSSVISIESADDNGATVKANKLGKATITATTPDTGNASIEIEVIRPEPESIKIDQSGPIKLYLGQKYSLSATLTPVEAEARLTWSSDDEGIATVEQDGMVTAVEPGETEIYVETYNDSYGDIDDSIDIHVLIPPKKIALSKSEATLAVGDTLTLKKTLTPEDAETGFTWSSSRPSVATVSKKGKVTALKTGTTKITVVTDNGKKASATITVKPAPTKVRLSKTRATLGVKEKLTLKATVSPSKAYTTLTWKSSKPAVATVSKQGVVTPRKPGTAVITVRTKNGKTAKFTVTVKAAPKKVTLNKSGTVELKKGKKLKLKATLPDNTASALTWTSSAPKVASVDQKGNVRALKKGTAVITVKTFNGKTAKVTVTVK